MTVIAPSILSADFSDLKQEIEKIEPAGADMLHLDIMDGHFVPNITFGPEIVKTIKKYAKIPLDVHLMINQPEIWLEKFYKAGADIITVHPESTTHLDRTISIIKTFGIKAGIALLPTTQETILDYVLDKIDLVLVMSVNPGFGGQQFMENQLSKISRIAQKITGTEILLSVDGGINNNTAKLCKEAGANMLVSGSYIFSGDYKQKINSLR